jgi:hypothetical protein
MKTLLLSALLVTSALAGDAIRFEPRFVVLAATNDPAPQYRWADLGPGARDKYNVLTWQTKPVKKVAKRAAKKEHVADGFDPAADLAKDEGRTFDIFQTGALETVNGSSDWKFPENSRFSLHATLGKGEDPLLMFTFIPKQDGWYSIGYVGAPEVELAALDEMWQPLVWQEKRFPLYPYLTEASRCTLPGTLVAQGGVVHGVLADPAELSFMPMPTPANSRFGVAVRNAAGKAQPTLFAPIPGGVGSQMKAGVPFTFKLRLVTRRGKITDAYESLARGLFQFRDYRCNNGLGSLNRTLERMIDYALGPWARFNDDLRGCSYDTDVPGSVKNVSALHPLGVALVTDDEQIFARRAQPIFEALLSREKFLFTTDPNIKGQGASCKLLGPSAPLSEMAVWFELTHQPCLLKMTEDLFGKTRTLNLDDAVPGNIWQNALALYRASGDAKWLKLAVAGADTYLRERIETPQTAFRDKYGRGMFFWTSYSPNWMELFELFAATGERRYLDASREGARRFAEFVWMCPVIPDGDVLVNEGGRAPTYRKSDKLPPILLPEEKVPAWRVSEIGLTCESSGTSKGHRGIFLATHAPYMLRLAELTGDAFLHDIARSAIIGRYTSFPGYHMNTARTTVYEKPNFAERPTDQINSTSSLHYNHIWPQVALLVDYLVADASFRSKGAISFPSHFTEGYAYLQGRIYGDRPGMFYGEKDVWLWMPKGLLTCDNPEVNYIAARGNGKLCFALMNQSAKPVTANCSVAYGDQIAPRKFTVTLAPNGITPHVLDGVTIAPKFRLAQALQPWKQDFVTLDYCGAHAMILNLGAGHRWAYVYLQERELKQATLHYSTGGAWQSVTDQAFPFEFSVPVPDAATEFAFKFETTNPAGEKTTSPTGRLAP